MTTHKYHAVYYLYVPFCIVIPVVSITLIVDVSLKKMFPALLTVTCVGLVNVSCSVKTSVPSILSSAQKMMPISEVPGTARVTVSIIVLLHPVAVKSFTSVEREFPSYQFPLRQYFK